MPRGVSNNKGDHALTCLRCEAAPVSHGLCGGCAPTFGWRCHGCDHLALQLDHPGPCAVCGEKLHTGVFLEVASGL
jgi:hypothetical protein